MRNKNIFTIPNILSMFRLLLLPLIVYMATKMILICYSVDYQLIKNWAKNNLNNQYFE